MTASVALLRPDYFAEINSHSKAYHLGFVVADGSLDDHDKTWRLGVALAQEARVSRTGNERTLLERLKTALGSGAKIGSHPKPKGLPGKVHSVSFGSNVMAMDLQMHGVFPRKKFDKIGVAPAGVPLRFAPDFARGLLDGDGSIGLHLKRLPTGFVFWERQPYWDNSRRVLEWLLECWHAFGVVGGVVAPSHKSYRLLLAGADARTAIAAMYRNAGEHFLLRKWRRAHLHPMDWEDYNGDRSRLPPPHQERHRTGPKVGTTRAFDYDAIGRDIQECRLAYWEIEKKHGCSRQVINTVKRLLGGGYRQRVTSR